MQEVRAADARGAGAAAGEQVGVEEGGRRLIAAPLRAEHRRAAVAMPMLHALKATLIDTIYPPRCLACTEATDAAARPLPACWRDTHFIAGPDLRQVRRAADRRGRGGGLCESCQRHPPAWDRGAAALLYAGAGRRMVLALKHGDRLDMVRPLAGWMAAAGRELLARPTSSRRCRCTGGGWCGGATTSRPSWRGRWRGGPGGRCVPDLLARRRATAPQERMDRDAAGGEPGRRLRA